MIAFNLNERADARLMPVVYRAPQRPRQLPRTVIAAFATCSRIQNRQYSPNITDCIKTRFILALNTFGLVWRASLRPL